MSITPKTYHLSKADLPASCPRPDMALWNAHPRVYLPLEETGHAICPYCSTEYIVDPNDA